MIAKPHESMKYYVRRRWGKSLLHKMQFFLSWLVCGVEGLGGEPQRADLVINTHQLWRMNTHCLWSQIQLSPQEIPNSQSISSSLWSGRTGGTCLHEFLCGEFIFITDWKSQTFTDQWETCWWSIMLLFVFITITGHPMATVICLYDSIFSCERFSFKIFSELYLITLPTVLWRSE